MKNIFLSKLFILTLALQALYTFACYFFIVTDTAQGLGVGVFLLLAGSLLSATLNRLPTYFHYRKAFNQLNLYSDAVAASTSQLFDATQLVSSASTEQAASIQQTVATITELNTTINKSVENAQRSFEVAEGSKAIATEGHMAVTDMIGAMDQINGSNNKIVAEIETSNERITNIVKVITEISNKTKIINDIVFQTKLLSFNASVEAARAGEHGKGFAVVAEEIGNLAQMSGTASREISEMLHLSIKKVNGIVEDTSVKVQGLMQEGKANVSTGILVAKRCGDILQQVVGSVGQVNHMISEISHASKEQALGMNEIAHAMTQLDTATQQNANTAQNLADCSADISWHTERFRDSLSALRDDRLGATSPKITRLANHDPLKPQGFSPAPAGTLNFRRRAAEPSAGKVIKRAVGGDVPLGDSPDFEDV